MSKETTPDTLVIIVMYNGMRWINVSVESALDLGDGCDIVIVDNASIDGTAEVLRKDYVDKVKELFLLNHNVGFGAAHNIVFNQPYIGMYQFVFLLNQDAFISRKDFSKLHTVALRESNLGIISPIHMRDKWQMDISFERYLAKGEERGDGQVLVVPFVNAALWLLRSEVIKQIGGFNPVFYHYGEDENFVQRLYASGFEVGVCMQATGYHYRAATPLPSRFNITPYRQVVLSKIRLVSPNHTFVQALLSVAYDYVELCIGLILEGRLRMVLSHLVELLKIVFSIRALKEWKTIYISPSRALTSIGYA
jgi:GT2 family glycosyltransferase